MYIQITDRCNMECIHCCFDCNSIGNDMSIKTFKAAAQIAQYNGDNIFIGGGEPTLHPDFWTIMGLALAYSEEDIPGIITNGSITKTSILLANMAKRGIIYAALSQDVYHDLIESEVIKAFVSSQEKYINSIDRRDIRDVSDKLIASGRSINNKNADKEQCVGSDVFVDPLGNIFSCGCKTEKLGTVSHPNKDLSFFCKKDMIA